MHKGIQSLSGREVEVLRLLLTGHDAKSIARLLGLSVHAVNERLRRSRMKLGVSSSREAARLLAETENQGPKFFVDENIGAPQSLVDKRIGVPITFATQHPGAARQHERSNDFIGWLAGGVLIMSLIIGTLLFTSPGASEGALEQAQGAAVGDFATSPTPAEAAPTLAEAAMDLMPIADINSDGRVTAREYRIFSEQGWEVVAEGRDQVRLAELDPMSQAAFVGITPNSGGVITRQMYLDAIPVRFRMFDQNNDNALSADELNGRAFSGQDPPRA